MVVFLSLLTPSPNSHSSHSISTKTDASSRTQSSTVARHPWTTTWHQPTWLPWKWNAAGSLTTRTRVQLPSTRTTRESSTHRHMILPCPSTLSRRLRRCHTTTKPTWQIVTRTISLRRSGVCPCTRHRTPQEDIRQIRIYWLDLRAETWDLCRTTLWAIKISFSKSWISHHHSSVDWSRHLSLLQIKCWSIQTNHSPMSPSTTTTTIFKVSHPSMTITYRWSPRTTLWVAIWSLISLFRTTFRTKMLKL